MKLYSYVCLLLPNTNGYYYRYYFSYLQCDLFLVWLFLTVKKNWYHAGEQNWLCIQDTLQYLAGDLTYYSPFVMTMHIQLLEYTVSFGLKDQGILFHNLESEDIHYTGYVYQPRLRIWKAICLLISKIQVKLNYAYT